MKKLLVAVMGCSLVVFAAAPVSAQESAVTSGESASNVDAAVVLANKKQTKVTIDNFVTGSATNLPGNTYVAIDGAKVLNCGTTSCVLSADISIQVGPSSPASTGDCQIAFLFRVDGADQPGSSHYAGVIDVDTPVFQNVAATLTSIGSFAPGNHTVQTFVGAFGANPCASRAKYHVKYTQYKP